jgi:TRAP-type transport system periplasmic protein
MFRFVFRVAALAVVLCPALATADPINLKLSFFTSDQSAIYQASIKPFVEAVNRDGEGLIHITVYFSGTISAVQSQQPQLISDGAADLAMVVPSQTPDRFPDTSALELPGLFPNSLAASRVFTRLMSSGALSGYRPFYAVDAFISGAEDIHSRTLIASTADLKNLRIRVNNLTEAAVLQKFGAIPVVLPINRTTDALSRGAIDGAAFPPSMLFQFGIGRVATHHFMMGLGGVPVALLMNRKKFEGLPPPAQAIIRKYSGQWLSDRSVKQLAKLDRDVLKRIEAEPRRTVTFPSAADAKTIRAVYGQVIDEYSGSSDHHRDLLARIRAELARLPATE